MSRINRNQLSLAVTAVPLLVGTLLAGFPSQGAAQECWGCGWSDEKQWPSIKCYEDAGDRADCETRGGPVTTCHPDEEECEAWASAATDEEAIKMIRKGYSLPADGGYFFVSQDAVALVMRKCDLSLVARIPSWAVAGAGNRADWKRLQRHATGDGTWE